MQDSLCSIACLILAASGLNATAPPPTAVKSLQLFEQLRRAESQARGPAPRHVSFRLTDTEINDYTSYSLKATPRPGVDSVTVKIFPKNYVSTFTIVDFDAVERWRPGTIPLLLRPILRDKQSIWVDYRFQAAGNRLTFTVEKAYYGKIRVPAFFVQKMIQVVAARQPENYDTSKPMPLPFGLRQLSTVDHIIAGEN
jgi:hypothetical protein